MRESAPETLSALPPIVLFVEEGRGILDTYAAMFEAEGVWVSTATRADEALSAVQELKPDVVVTDAAFADTPGGAEFVHALKASERTQDVPLIVLTSRSRPNASEGTPEADLYLEQPILPETLLNRVREVLQQSHDLRARGDRARKRAAGLVQYSNQLMGPANASSRTDAPQRSCPRCGERLEWIERGRIGGADYDYYRWCQRGCGLYCYDRNAGDWLKLA